MTTDLDHLKSVFADEVVTKALVRDVELPDGGGTLALVTIDNGHDHTKPTTFGPNGLVNLNEALEGLSERGKAGEIVAVAVTGKPFIFAVGADIKGIPLIRTRDDAVAVGKLGHDAYSQLDALAAEGIPSFAFVNGATMGGGVELALSATYRTISDAAGMFSLPECFIGLVPGWGGCWRLPNLIGVEKALTVIIDNPLEQNRMLKPAQVAELGIADALLPAADFLTASVRWAADVLAGRITVDRPEIDRDEATWNAAVDAAYQRVLGRTGGASPAPLAALDLVRAARTNTREEGFAAEDQVLADRIVSDETRASLYAFDLVQRRAKRPTNAPDKSLARKITKVGIAGAGLMAGQIAMLLVQRLKVPVVLNDIDQARVDKGVAYVHEQIGMLALKGRLSQDEHNRLVALVTGSVDKAAFAGADLVIEAIVEVMEAKKSVFAEIEPLVSEECVLATNTSSLSITEMASGLKHPERVVGVHFFNPVQVMPLVEIIPGERTDDATTATAFALGKSLRKTCVLAADAPSFIVNRVLGRFMSDISKIVDAGTPIEVADAAFAGIVPLPPFHLIALVGPAIALHNGETLAGAFPERFRVSENLAWVVENGIRSYYTQDEAGNQVIDPRIVEHMSGQAQTEVLTAEQVRERTLEGLAEEIGIMLREGVAAGAPDLDLAMITGAGMHFWNGGITPLLDRLGISEKVNGARFLPVGIADAGAVTG
ncbi:MAG: 3-hydroxyacyl-CoA dehydrogenase NAD-binding domain-containing protein [Dermatophilus congolensis]|nr:3-hydroxyacyl-CoA dehydrogenase NAD-binding domain-containing protein [Dermatophilus congolensis]